MIRRLAARGVLALAAAAAYLLHLPSDDGDWTYDEERENG